MEQVLEKKELIKIESKERNMGIDLLRIVSMFMVVILHVLGQGGILGSLTDIMSVKYQVMWFIEIMAYCAVNCYALISGYVGINAKFKYSNIILLWLQVLFYTIIVTGIYAIVFPNNIGFLDIAKAIFPVMFGTYWYFTAYFGMFFFIPFFNYLVNSLPRKEMDRLVLSGIILFSILATFFHSNSFQLLHGYSIVWLSFLYILGAYIKKHDVFASLSKIKLIGIYFTCVILTWMSKFCIEILTLKILGQAKGGGYLMSYISPFILLDSVALLCLFSKIKLKSGVKRIISILAPLTFGVYLFHEMPFIRENFIINKFSYYSKFSTAKFVFMLLLSGIVIYVISSVIEFIRATLFKKLKLKNKLIKLLHEDR